jgi:hypothetical protein
VPPDPGKEQFPAASNTFGGWQGDPLGMQVVPSHEVPGAQVGGGGGAGRQCTMGYRAFGLMWRGGAVVCTATHLPALRTYPEPQVTGFDFGGGL